MTKCKEISVGVCCYGQVVTENRAGACCYASYGIVIIVTTYRFRDGDDG